MDPCLLAGPVASLAVQALKRLEPIQRHPKVVLALLTGAYAYLAGTGLECWLGAFMAGIAGYEVAIKPVAKVLEGGDKGGGPK